MMMRSLQLAVVALGLACTSLPATSQSKGFNTAAERRDNFKIYSRVSQNYRQTTREISSLQPWHQYQSIVFGVFFGTSDVKILGPDRIQCARCNDNPVASAVAKLKTNCEGSMGVAEPALIPTASQSVDPKTGEPVMKSTYWLKNVYRCDKNPFAAENSFHQENRLTLTKASNQAIQQFVSQKCSFYSDASGFRVDIAGNVIAYPWVNASSHVSTKEFVDIAHPDDFWFRPVGRLRSEAIELSDLFFSPDQLNFAAPLPISNAVPESIEYAYIRTPGGGFVRVDFEQNAIVSLNSYLPQSDSFFTCEAVPGSNGFTGLMQFNRTE